MVLLSKNVYVGQLANYIYEFTIFKDCAFSLDLAFGLVKEESIEIHTTHETSIEQF